MQDLIDQILYSKKEESKQAKERFAKIEQSKRLESSLAKLFFDNFDKLENNDNYNGIANFIYAAKWQIFFSKKEHFDLWVKFLLNHILSPSGLVRNAVVKVFPNLLFSLRFSKNFLSSPTKNDLKLIEKYGQLCEKIEILIFENQNEAYLNEKYKYISDLPISVYKSLNYLLSDLKYYCQGEKIIDYYNENIVGDNKKEQLSLIMSFDEYLKSNSLTINIADIVEIIYQESSEESVKIALSYICSNNAVSPELIPQILKNLNILWQALPHFDLGGKAPIELT